MPLGMQELTPLWLRTPGPERPPEMGVIADPVDRFVIRRTLLAEVDPDRETARAASQGVILRVSMSAPLNWPKCGSRLQPDVGRHQVK